MQRKRVTSPFSSLCYLKKKRCGPRRNACLFCRSAAPSATGMRRLGAISLSTKGTRAKHFFTSAARETVAVVCHYCPRVSKERKRQRGKQKGHGPFVHRKKRGYGKGALIEIGTFKGQGGACRGRFTVRCCAARACRCALASRACSRRARAAPKEAGGPAAVPHRGR